MIRSGNELKENGTKKTMDDKKKNLYKGCIEMGLTTLGRESMSQVLIFLPKEKLDTSGEKTFRNVY